MKDTLKEGLDITADDMEEQGYSILEAHESKREIVPLFEGVKDNHNDIDSANAKNEEIEEVIPIFGEEIVITKER